MPTFHLTIADKHLLMERFWEELSRRSDDIPIPDWQKEILSERIASVHGGHTTFQDWGEAKKRLRERHK